MDERKIKNSEKTIVAISTAMGFGGIAIVRLSGENAKKIALQIVEVKEKNIEPRYFYYGTLKTENIKDEVMLVIFEKNKSFTFEQMAEIHCHGNNLIASEILRECIKRGCVLAESGEFTKRAFLNGRIDLSEAEAVSDLINAESEAEINSAFNALKGEIFNETQSIQRQIVSLIARCEVAIDYPEENIEFETKENIFKELDIIKEKLNNFCLTFNEGKYIKNGVRVAIIGKPNVGKSLLLNRLIGRNRAIVTEESGTTRDTLEEVFLINGQRFIIVDTAGLRETENNIEKLGIQRSYDEIKGADIILAVSEKNESFTEKLPNNKKIIYVKNKADLIDKIEDNNNLENKKTIYISAKNGYNINKLKELIYNEIFLSKISGSGAVLSNVRHYNACFKALTDVLNAQNDFYVKDIEFILSDLNSAYRELGRITGVTASDEIINEIFSRFCVGK